MFKVFKEIIKPTSFTKNVNLFRSYYVNNIIKRKKRLPVSYFKLILNGYFYVFWNINIRKELYYNQFPVFFCLSPIVTQGSLSFFGLDFMYFPPKERVLIFFLIYKLFKKYYDALFEKHSFILEKKQFTGENIVSFSEIEEKKDKVFIPKNHLFPYTKNIFLLMENMFRKNKIYWEYGAKTYNIREMVNLSFVPIEHWNMIMYLPSVYFKNIKFTEIYKLYYDGKNALNVYEK